MIGTTTPRKRILVFFKEQYLQCNRTISQGLQGFTALYFRPHSTAPSLRQACEYSRRHCLCIEARLPISPTRVPLTSLLPQI